MTVPATKKFHNSQYGPSPPINAWCSSADHYSGW
nr:NADH-plastoquinone oxidoreductase subunit 7 [Cypripedium debile]UPQ44451.1 NADH-plastoquinone oxidoreductase subunit 7 [Cypripedium debile]